MTSNDAVDYSGLVQDLLEFGFTTQHVLSEVIDDCFGAGATSIEFHINTTDHEMLIIDNAKGMTAEELVQSHRLFKRTEASDERQGRFGIGSKVAKVHLTQHRQPTTVVSKTVEGEIYSITVDWNRAVTHNNLELVATEASRRNEDLWNKYCVGAGTVARIPLHPKIEKELIASLEDGTFQKYFSRMYSKDLLEGKVIKFLYNSKGVILTPTDILELDTCTFKQSTEVEVYEKNDDIRLYFVNGNGEKVYKNAEGNQAHDEPTDFALVGKIKIDSAIKSQIVKESEKWTDWEVVDGGIFIRRMGKVIEQISIPPTTAGDYGWRCLLNSSRHLVSFNSSLDGYFGIEINKSHIKEANINKKVIGFIRWLAKDFIQKKWTYIKKQNEDAKKKTPPPQPPPQPQPDESNVIRYMGGGGGTAVEIIPPPEPAKKTKSLPVATPIPIPAPDTKIVITNHRAENNIQISENNRIIYKFPYAGQAHHTEEMLRAWLMRMGEARFKTFVSEFAVMCDSYTD
jgi:hypothetical protein